MAEAKTSLRDPARLCATRHAIAEAPPARRQAADDPRRSEGSGFYKRNSAVRIGEAPSDAVPRRPATAPRSQARSHDITVTSGLTGAPDPRVKRSSVTFRASKPPFLSAGTESSNPPPSSGESCANLTFADESAHVASSSRRSSSGETQEVKASADVLDASRLTLNLGCS